MTPRAGSSTRLSDRARPGDSRSPTAEPRLRHRRLASRSPLSAARRWASERPAGDGPALDATVERGGWLVHWPKLRGCGRGVGLPSERTPPSATGVSLPRDAFDHSSARRPRATPGTQQPHTRITSRIACRELVERRPRLFQAVRAEGLRPATRVRRTALLRRASQAGSERAPSTLS
jgi:hypothetical protein